MNERQPSQTALDERPFRPVKALAAVGAFALLMEALIIGRWVTGPHFKATPIGPSEVPTYMKVGLTGLTIIGLVAWAVCIWYFLIKPSSAGAASRIDVLSLDLAFSFDARERSIRNGDVIGPIGADNQVSG